jgi:hypothetical protein
MAPRWQAGMGCASGLILEPHTYTYLYIDSGKNNIFMSFYSPCDPSGRHRALFTTRSGEPGTGSPVPVPVRVEQPSRKLEPRRLQSSTSHSCRAIGITCLAVHLLNTSDLL